MLILYVRIAPPPRIPCVGSRNANVILAFILTLILEVRVAPAHAHLVWAALRLILATSCVGIKTLIQGAKGVSS